MLKQSGGSEKYVLATGDQGAFRLQVVNRVHGQDTADFLNRMGVQPGWKIADIGCGVGTVSRMMADLVGETGCVSAVDISPAQIATADALTRLAGYRTIEFQPGSAHETGLPSEFFDLVYCRFVLMHVRDVPRAMCELLRIVKPGGILAVEDGDFTGPFAEPSSESFDRCFQLYREVVRAQGADPELGKRLFGIFQGLGLIPSVRIVQPVFAIGEEKRLPEWTILECADHLLEAGLATRGEIEFLCAELKKAAEDPAILIGMARMFQVWALKTR